MMTTGVEKVDGTWTCAKHKAMGDGSTCPSCVVEIVKAERAELTQVVINALADNAAEWSSIYGD